VSTPLYRGINGETVIMKRKIGFTTSLPIEVLFAASATPVDLNNIFINNSPEVAVRNAELSGFPRNICAWIKGMYSVIMSGDIDIVIGVAQGDCSNTKSLLEILSDMGKEILYFSYPADNDYTFLDREISKLEKKLGVVRSESQSMKKELDSIRKQLVALDEMTWQTGEVTPAENHYWLVTSSDFQGDFVQYASDLEKFINMARERSVAGGQKQVRLGYVGVPPIICDLYTFLDTHHARIVYHEVQRQFSMPYLTGDLVEQYLRFTYPYAIFDRIADIKQAITLRKLDGLIAYTQSFCHRQLDIISLKKHIDIPILKIEGDCPGRLDSRSQIRIESFIEMITG
jgi:benzoyl-CoA reductase/2-hydroxyglutaryl-CoA dehydratase subunit BcrC/BadD/HgdB